MSINLTYLQQYSDKKSSSFHIAINTETPYEPILIITKGKYEQNGGTTIFMEFEDFKNILLINNIYGETGLLKTERNALTDDLNNGLGDRNKREERMDDLVYGTLVKYLTQMLNASLGKILYPEVIPLDKHKDHFRE